MTKLISLLLATMFLSACGQGSIVTKIDVSSEVDSANETHVNLEAYINLGSLKFPALTIPIKDPSGSGVQVGAISLSRTLDGLNVLGLSANASRLLQQEIDRNPRLPNGNAIPIAGTPTVVINVGRSKLYIGAGAHSIVGLAIVIPEFDEIGKMLPGVNLFLGIPKELGVNGVAGAFTGGPSQNGIGLFVQVPQLNSGANERTLMMTKESTDLRFITSNESSRQSQDLKKLLYKKSQKNQTLRVR